MQIAAIRSLNSFIIIISFFFGIYLTMTEEPGATILVFVIPVVAALYCLVYLMEPYVTRLLFHKLESWDRLPFELVLLQYTFGQDLKQIVLLKDEGSNAQGFGSGNGVYGFRLYLQERFKNETNLSQMKGFFGSELARISLGHYRILWITGAAGVLSILTAMFFLTRFASAEAMATSLFLSQAPIAIYLVDLLVTFVSRRLVFAADRYAVHRMSYRDFMCDFLHYLHQVEASAGEARNPFAFFGQTSPPAAQRLGKIAEPPPPPAYFRASGDCTVS